MYRRIRFRIKSLTNTRFINFLTHPIMAFTNRFAKLGIVVLFSFIFCGVYLVFFKQPPADVLLSMNKESGADGFNDFGASDFTSAHKKVRAELKDIDDEEKVGDDEDDDEDEKASGRNRAQRDEIKGLGKWNKFLKINNYVPIGAVYDKCEGSRTQLGSVVLLEDMEVGGVKARIYVNMTLHDEITGGQFHIEVKYNGRALYDNYWELCELEDELPVQNRTFTCPIAPATWNKVKDKHVPLYLPAGRYQTKAWAVDESEDVIACGYSDFKL